MGQKKCFVIGPMGEKRMDMLRWLAEDVVQRLLPDWEVATPDSNIIGNVMNQVIKSCDRAQLVIANTNGNNPNVLYEIAVLDALGRPCIPVKIVDDDGVDSADPMTFDRAAYRYIEIYSSKERQADTLKVMRSAINAALEIRANGDTYENPITNFYGVPLSSLSSAYGLARGYFINLVRLAALNLPKAATPCSSYDPSRYSIRELQLILPDRLGNVSRESVSELLALQIIRKVTLSAAGREITLYEWSKQEGPAFHWVDFPTTLYTLRDNILSRLGRDANKDPERPDYRYIEEDEIEQFRLALEGQINKDSLSEDVRKVVRIMKWNDEALPLHKLRDPAKATVA